MTPLNENNEALAEVPAVPVSAPVIRQITINVASSAATVDTSVPFPPIPFARAAVLSVTYAPSGNITGEVTNNRTLTVTNKGSAAFAGSAIASRETTATLTGLINNTITLSENLATEYNKVNCHEGDVLVWKSAHNSSGCVDPGGTVTLTVESREVSIAKEQPGR